MERKAAYANLAKWFEYLNDDCDYENWSQYLIKKLRAFPLRTGLDAGCGGGWFTRAFERQGYRMTGLDVSPEMLDYAQETALKEGVRSEYLLGDIALFRSPKKYDFVTAINDCLNYIPVEKLDKTMRSVKNLIKKGGIFLFDVSTEEKIRSKIADTVCVDDREDVTYMSFNTPEKDGVTMDVTLFVKGADGRYERLDERHRQYIHTEDDLRAALERNGFTVLEFEGHLAADKTRADRWTVLAQRTV